MVLTSNDGVTVPHGESVIECAKVADSCKKVVAIGINCTAPRYIHELITSLRQVHINNDRARAFLFCFFSLFCALRLKQLIFFSL